MLAKLLLLQAQNYKHALLYFSTSHLLDRIKLEFVTVSMHSLLLLYDINVLLGSNILYSLGTLIRLSESWYSVIEA